ncbi:hypothetical protein P691DRAFT_770609, partial [Macrolepiota fuliginosa MF-IS2]
MVLGTSENNSQEACSLTNERGNSRSGTSRKNKAPSTKKVEDGSNAQPGASQPLNVSTSTAPQIIRTIQKSKQICRLWQSGNCEWGDKCCYQHKIQTTQSSAPGESTESSDTSGDLDPGETSDTAQTSIPNIAPSRARKKQQKKDREKAVPTIPAATAAPSDARRITETLRRVLKEAEAARQARQEQEALHEEKERVARLAREQEEAARLVQEREELSRKEREKAARTQALHHVLEAAEAARLARQQEEAACEEQERAARLVREREEAVRLAREQEEVARREQEEAAREERERAVRFAQEQEAARKEREEAARLAREREEVARREREEAARLAREQEVARREREEAVRKERERAANLAREREEAARLAREREEIARREREEAAREERETAARLAQEREAARKEREETARLAREQEEVVRRKREEAAREERERAARLAQEQEVTRKEREEAARLAREQEEIVRREREEAAREERERAARLAQEQEAARKEREEAARLAKERAARQKEEAARKKRERAARLAREQEIARKEREEAARLAKERVAAAARHEKQLQLARKREQAEKEERMNKRRKQKKGWAKERAVTIQQVVMNSFVKFESGLMIQNVICGLEATQILVKNLPVNAKESEILGLFTQRGIDGRDLAILRTENVNSRQQATVLGKAANMEAITLDLDGTVFQDKTVEFVVCERSSNSRTMGNTYHLSISWQAPFLTMMAYYPDLDSGEVTRKAVDLGGRFLGGQQIRAEYEEDHGHYLGDDYILPTRKVKISGIPAGTTIEDVQTFAGTQSVEPYTDPLSCTSHEVFSALDAHLRSLPNSTLRTFTLENSPRPSSVSAKAIFSTWKGAKSAHDDLKERVLRYNFPPLRLFLSHLHRFVLALDEKQYIAQKSQWTELCEGKDKETDVQARTVDRADGRKVVITLSGHDRKAVGALKVRIESMATGQRLDATYWHPTFQTAKGQEFLDSVYHMTGAYVRCDWEHDCIAASGRADAIGAAKSCLREEVERISAMQWTIPLQHRVLGFFVQEGLAKMKALLGEENVALDEQTCTMVLCGAKLEEARHYFKQLMDEFTDRNTTIDTSADTQALCPICHDTVSQPIQTSCEHVYCSSCLHHYILSTLDNRNFPLKCMGGDTIVCNQPLSIPLIKEFLPPHRFEQMVEAAFTSYIDKNPGTFKHCNTPDCTQIYRTTTLPHELQCPSCFSEVCAA